jgi:hypothetical protein
MAQTFSDGEQLSTVRSVLNGNAGDINVLQSQNAKSVSDVAALLANTSLTYIVGSNDTVAAGNIVQTRAENFSYQVAASGATDQSVTTAGGVKLYVLTPVATAFGAKGNGTTDDTEAFAKCDVTFLGDIVDLYGLTYLVTEIPTAATYVGGSFLKDGFNYNMPSTLSLITATSDTGGTDPVYSGGVLNLAPFSGRTTKDLFSLFNSQNSRSRGPSRAVNVGSIYSDASGNVSGNYSARQCLAWSPQSVNIASEECWVWGGFRGANLASIFSGCENESNANISSRRSYASGRHSANISSVDSYAGRGGGARFTVTTTGGVVTGITINAAGSGYDVLDAITIRDRSGLGAGATAEVASVDGTGGITGITLTAGGSNYSTRVDATVDNGTGDFSATLATDRAFVSGELAASMATSQCEISGNNAAVISAASATASGDKAIVIADQNSIASGDRAVVLGGSGSTSSGILSVAIAANICEATADGAVVFGRRTINNFERSIAFGDNASGAASTANRKFHLFANGDMSIAGTLTQSAIFTDYAEYFENAASGVIALGTLMALDGRKVRQAEAGDHILGVVSATASVAAGDSPFSWSKRYLTGEFGEMLYHDIPDPDWPEFVHDPTWVKGDDDLEANRPMVRNQVPAPLISVPMENPDYDATRENVPRSKRPDEWTCVGLLGQVHVRVGADVAVGDWVSANGNASKTQTNLRCMEIKSSYDASKRYAVAFCLLK